MALAFGLTAGQVVVGCNLAVEERTFEYFCDDGRYGHKELDEKPLNEGWYAAAWQQQKDMLGWTPLHWAAANGSTQWVDSFLRQRLFDVNCEDKNQATPLHFAAANGDKEMVSLLIQQGSKILAKDNFGWTAKDYARQKGHKDVVRLLEEALEKSEIQDDSLASEP